MNIQCAYSRLEDIHKLVENPKNPNNHPDKQIDLLAKIIDYQGQRVPIVVSKRSGFITKGHGRLMALKKLGWDQVAIDEQDYESEAMEFADVVADNKIAELAEHDDDMMMDLLKDIELDDYDYLGMLDFEMPKDGDSNDNIDNQDTYTRKIESPVYEPNGEQPALSDLYNTEKTNELLEQIEESSVTEETKQFLRLAAYRHLKFNYKNIAEYYAHTDKESQNLIENSALVIIDFNKSIELGFTKLTQKVRDAYAKQK